MDMSMNMNHSGHAPGSHLSFTCNGTHVSLPGWGGAASPAHAVVRTPQEDARAAAPIAHTASTASRVHARFTPLRLGRRTCQLFAPPIDDAERGGQVPPPLPTTPLAASDIAAPAALPPIVVDATTRAVDRHGVPASVQLVGARRAGRLRVPLGAALDRRRLQVLPHVQPAGTLPRAHHVRPAAHPGTRRRRGLRQDPRALRHAHVPALVVARALEVRGREGDAQLVLPALPEARLVPVRQHTATPGCVRAAPYRVHPCSLSICEAGTVRAGHFSITAVHNWQNAWTLFAFLLAGAPLAGGGEGGRALARCALLSRRHVLVGSTWTSRRAPHTRRLCAAGVVDVLAANMPLPPNFQHFATSLAFGLQVRGPWGASCSRVHGSGTRPGAALST